MRFFQVDVFAEGPYAGNPLAVFPEASELDAAQMQAIALEMNLSETIFITSASDASYSARIFTPAEELPFAGHPTLGAAWTLREMGIVTSSSCTQNTGAGETHVRFDGEMVWLTRTGASKEDLESTQPDARGAIARALGLQEGDVGLEARELGRSGFLRPALADTGLEHLIVPVRNLEALGRARADGAALDRFSHQGAYCFTAVGAGRVRARGLFPNLGIEEDPATGSAAADLGAYLVHRIGAIDLEVDQGVEMGRPSRLHVKAGPDAVEVGGRCVHIFAGELDVLP